MSRQFLLDGYNVLGKMPHLSERSLEDRRRGLVQFVERHQPQGSLRNQVMIVFDGQEGIGGSPGMSSLIKVVFSRGENADECIKRHVERAQRPADIIVVTDDREVQHSCRTHGAEIWSVAAFLARGRKEAGVSRKGCSDSSSSEEGKRISWAQEQRINQELGRIWLEE